MTRNPISLGSGAVVVVEVGSGDVGVGSRSSNASAGAVALVGRTRGGAARYGLGSVVEVVVAVFLYDAVLHTKLGRALEGSDMRRGLTVIARSAVPAACRLAFVLRLGFCRGAARAVSPLQQSSEGRPESWHYSLGESTPALCLTGMLIKYYSGLRVYGQPQLPCPSRYRCRAAPKSSRKHAASPMGAWSSLIFSCRVLSPT